MGGRLGRAMVLAALAGAIVDLPLMIAFLALVDARTVPVDGTSAAFLELFGATALAWVGAPLALLIGVQLLDAENQPPPRRWSEAPGFRRSLVAAVLLPLGFAVVAAMVPGAHCPLPSSCSGNVSCPASAYVVSCLSPLPVQLVVTLALGVPGNAFLGAGILSAVREWPSRSRPA